MTTSTLWWLLRVVVPEHTQLDLWRDRQPHIARADLLAQLITLVAKDIRIEQNGRWWGIANVSDLNTHSISGYLTVRSDAANIGLEATPGELSDAESARFYTVFAIDTNRQTIAVMRNPDILRFVRSPKALAAILAEFFRLALVRLELDSALDVEVDPIASTGSFTEWVGNIESLDKLTIYYRGPNLPSVPRSLVSAIRGAAKDMKAAVRSPSVELTANRPKLTEDEVEELDEAVAKRELKLTAKGTKNAVRTTWRSSTNPRPLTVRLEVEEEELAAELPVVLRALAAIASLINRT